MAFYGLFGINKHFGYRTKNLEIALFYVEQSSLNEDLVFLRVFPWATNNLFDELISGGPPEKCVGRKYFILWEELHSTTALERDLTLCVEDVDHYHDDIKI